MRQGLRARCDDADMRAIDRHPDDIKVVVDLTA
jgi:hypothetical protein